MGKMISAVKTQHGITARAYPGDGSILLAFNMDEKPDKNFAGFAIKRIPPKGKAQFLLNRLSFEQAITHTTAPEERIWTPSDQAPFQKFRWVDFPPDLPQGKYVYEITVMNFAKDGSLTPGPMVPVEVEMPFEHYTNFDMGFTRGYLSSQAYADRFNNAEIRPAGPKTIDYDTAPFQAQYEWLGARARQLVFQFLNEALADPKVELDVFAYDLDEPDIIASLVQFGKRLRLYLDNSTLHTKAGAVEPQAKAAIIDSAGADHVETGHFGRFAHNKVLIQKKNGQAIKVLTGSANFSVRGLYVQANNVLVFNEPTVAKLYEEAFQQAFQDPKGFAGSAIAQGWNAINVADCPDCEVAFSPHRDAGVSLDLVAEAIKNAKSSIMFAVMELGGSGPVMDQIHQLGKRSIFSYGVTQGTQELKFFKPGNPNCEVVPFAYLKDKVPAPFKKEWSGGMGQVIHHKFVVVDFNTSHPLLFTGSSNLAAGGEKENGDNLLAINNAAIVAAYAVEAVRLLDHYQFRAAMQAATKVQPLQLQTATEDGTWWEPYFDKEDIKYQDRMLFAPLT